MSYDRALTWLFKQTRAGAPRSLERMRLLWSTFKLVSPPKVIHVVGTNGKGSVSYTLASELSSAGFKVGRFSSPHVSSFGERITLTSKDTGMLEIPKSRVISFVDSAKQLSLEHQPAFFELTFALALLYFKEQKVDYAIIEAGVGAKLDATNIIENVCATVITNVALDHQESLGYSLSEIAADKAEAIRKNTACITAAQGSALDVITKQANRQNSLLITVPNYDDYRKQNKELSKKTLELLNIPGAPENHTTHRSQLPARLEYFSIPVEGSIREVVLDAAHNVHAAQALLKLIEKPFVLLYAAKSSKDAEATLAVLERSAHTVILTTVLAEPTQVNRSYKVIKEPVDALEFALNKHTNLPLVVTGSFYLAGSVRSLLIARDSSRNSSP